ncbi:MAG: Transcriptional regulator TetR family [Solirubrobacterales bacterium]|nr:Transcriptional regulator TetR family [Solirubrobacterales bacterium]
MQSAGPDQRREVGLRTRARLMDAALELLSERGEDGVTLRELTDAADANVAAVSYHFGSLRSLFDAAIEDALERYLNAQEEAVSALDPDSTLEALAAAFARPLIGSLVAGGRDLAVMRIVARAGIDPPEGSGRLDVRFEQIRGTVLRVLKANLHGANDQELIFRTRCVAGLINWLVLAPVADELSNKSQKHIERLLVPILAGAFRAAGSG